MLVVGIVSIVFSVLSIADDIISLSRHEGSNILGSMLWLATAILLVIASR